jgi:RNA polymerase sigma-70 factor, ECF subfamily
VVWVSVERLLILDSLTQTIAPALDPASAEEGSAPAFLLDEGDLGALGRLYEEHHAAVRAFARRLLGDDSAEDLVHDTFLTLPKALRRWSGGGSLRAFIIGIAVNHARHHIRSATRRRRALARLSREPLPLPPCQEAASEQRRLADALMRAFDAISFDHRTTFVLCEVEERSAAEVAHILGIPEATVRTRLYHARQKLRAALEKAGVR